METPLPADTTLIHTYFPKRKEELQKRKCILVGKGREATI